MQECKDGGCVPIESTTSGTNAECDDNTCPCEGNLDCPEGSICDQIRAVCILKECELESDCDIGLTCLSNRCVVDLEADQDRDGVPDNVDNCPEVINPDQNNTDKREEGLPGGPLRGDEQGDACDDDIDNDGLLNEEDNCLDIYNPDQLDSDRGGEGDGVGDRCEPTLRGVCGDCPVDRIEGDTLYCDDSCDPTPRCVPGRARCNDNVREECDQTGSWEQVLCSGDENCFEVSEF